MMQHLEGRRNAPNVQQSPMTTPTPRGVVQPANLNFPRIPRAVTMVMVIMRGVAVQRVMVARKRTTRPILTINSEIVEEWILRGDQQGRVLAFLHYSILYLFLRSFRSVNDVLCHLRKNMRNLYTHKLVYTSCGLLATLPHLSLSRQYPL